MSAMFELGRQRGRGPDAWTRLDQKQADQPFIPQTRVDETQVPAVLAPEPSSKPEQAEAPKT